MSHFRKVVTVGICSVLGALWFITGRSSFHWSLSYGFATHAALGSLVGLILSVGVVFFSVRLSVVFPLVGALIPVTMLPLMPCDGTIQTMPLLGAILGSSIYWFGRLMKRCAASIGLGATHGDFGSTHPDRA